MRYMGGKFHLAKWICPILIDLMQTRRLRNFVDLFCGACNVVGNMPADRGRRIANDRHPDLIALWQAVQTGYTPPRPARPRFTSISWPLAVSPQTHCERS